MTRVEEDVTSLLDESKRAVEANLLGYLEDAMVQLCCDSEDREAYAIYLAIQKLKDV